MFRMIGDESQSFVTTQETDFTVSDISLNHMRSRTSSGQGNLFLNRKARETIPIGKAKIWFFTWHLAQARSRTMKNAV